MENETENANAEQSKDIPEIDTIPIVETGSSFDAKQYKGLKIKIAKVEIDKNAINWYNGPADARGRPTYNPASTETMWKAVITTEGLPKLDENGQPTNEKLMRVDADGNLVERVVTARFNFTNKDGKWVISKSPSAKLWKFMRKQGVTKLSDLVGTIVLLDVEPSRDETDDRYWLRIAI